MTRTLTGNIPVGGKCQYLIPSPGGPEFANDPGIIWKGTIDEDGTCDGWEPVPSTATLQQRAGGRPMRATLAFVLAGAIILGIIAHRS